MLLRNEFGTRRKWSIPGSLRAEWWVAILCLLAAGWLYLGGTLSDRDVVASSQASHGQYCQAEQIPFKSIDKIVVGDRVQGINPQSDWDATFGPVNKDWRQVHLVAAKEDGSSARVVLLRPQSWLEEQRAEVGEVVHIEVPECGIHGDALVIGIESCPALRPGDGCLVTGTFHHSAAALIDLTIEGESTPIGATPNHPVWSEDRQAFVRADELRPGERLRSLSGICRLIASTPRDTTEAVFNIEVHGSHVYHVGELGILVHNGGPCPTALVKMLEEGMSLSNKTKTFLQASKNKHPKTFASAPDGAIYISGYTDMIPEGVVQDLKTITHQRWNEFRKDNVKSIVKYFEDIGFPIRGGGAGDYIDVNGVRTEVRGLTFSSHAEIQAAYDVLVKNKATRDKFIKDGKFVINISHAGGPCEQSCIDALTKMAKAENVTIRIEWPGPKPDVHFWREFTR